jgi:hypothetical protein
MKEKIICELKQIEFQENVKVLYACESGSRAWGFPSKDSETLFAIGREISGCGYSGG